MLNFELMVKSLPNLISASGSTILLSLASILLSLILGGLLGVLAVSEGQIIKGIIGFIVYCIRGTPLLVQIFLAYFGLPVIGIELSAFQAGILALSVNSGAYLTEIVRAALISVGTGQIEAAKVLGISLRKTTVFILLPQAVKRMIPPVTNELITLIKNTSLLATIGVYELTRAGQTIISLTFRPFEIYILIALLYLVITTVVSRASNIMERKLEI